MSKKHGINGNKAVICSRVCIAVDIFVEHSLLQVWCSSLLIVLTPGRLSFSADLLIFGK